MVDGLILDLPSETEMMEFLLRSRGEFGLTDGQISALRALTVELQSTLIEASSSIRKAELRQQSGEDPSTARSADVVIADALAAGAAARARANVELRRIPTPDQYRLAADAIRRRSVGAPDSTSGHVGAADHPSKDQKVVEIETAVMIAERVVSWAKLFAWIVALPAALLIAILTMIGIGKFSDFTTLVRESETKLKSTVAQATTNADLLAQKVADLTQKQTESDRQLGMLSKELRSVKEKLGFAQGSSLAPDTQKRLQDLFTKFQAYVVGLGYSPGDSEIKIAVLPDDKSGPMAYYDKNTIFVAKARANDPEVIYREYLHHVLYSKVGLDNVGPERSALESGVADYIVASYAGAPQVYRLSLGTPVNLEGAEKVRPAAGHGDRFPVGRSWAGLFWQLRQSIGREITDKAVFAAWFDLTKEHADPSIPGEMVTRLLARAAPTFDNPVRGLIVKIVQERGAPLPKTP